MLYCKRLNRWIKYCNGFLKVYFTASFLPSGYTKVNNSQRACINLLDQALDTLIIMISPHPMYSENMFVWSESRLCLLFSLFSLGMCWVKLSVHTTHASCHVHNYSWQSAKYVLVPGSWLNIFIKDACCICPHMIRTVLLIVWSVLWMECVE